MCLFGGTLTNDLCELTISIFKNLLICLLLKINAIVHEIEMNYAVKVPNVNKLVSLFYIKQ